MKKALIVGGGTGGHVFCGLAIAEALKIVDSTCEIRFGGSARGLENVHVPKAGYRLYKVPIQGWYRVSWWKKVRVMALLPVAVLQSMWTMLWYRPHLVIGVGGYASVPFFMAAIVLRVPIAVVEFNVVPGIANLLVASRAAKSFVGVDEIAHRFNNPLVVGTPLRRAILAQREVSLPVEKPCLLIVGGSQGARIINRAIIEALPIFAKWAQLQSLQIVHQCGNLDLKEVQAAYAQYPQLHAVITPFIEHIETAYAQASLVISRAGASAVNELVAVRRPVVFIPITVSSGDHQRQNAQRIAAAGAAMMIEESQLQPEAFAKQIMQLLSEPQQLLKMAQQTDTLYQGDAAMSVAQHCMTLMRR